MVISIHLFMKYTLNSCESDTVLDCVVGGGDTVVKHIAWCLILWGLQSKYCSQYLVWERKKSDLLSL